MKWRSLIGGVLVVVLCIGLIWALVPFKVGEVEYSTPMSPENVILTKTGSDVRLASHLRGVTDYVSKLEGSPTLESFTRDESPPYSRFLPIPQTISSPYSVVVVFKDGRGDRYTATFSGAIEIEIHGAASPRYVSLCAAGCINDLVETVFQTSPAIVSQFLLRDRHGLRRGE